MIEGHTHHFGEAIGGDHTGTTKRCQCGARLWEPAAIVKGPVVIRKRGYFYRPGWCGYTSSIREAGRYERSEAALHAATVEGVSVHEITEFA